MRWFSPARLAVFGAAAVMMRFGRGARRGRVGDDQGAESPSPARTTRPSRSPANVDKDQAVCLKNGPIYKSDYVVNPKNKGVRWVVVWLVDAEDYKKELPIHPDLKEPKDKTVVLDQPCCQFVPHIVALREGQDLEIEELRHDPAQHQDRLARRQPQHQPAVAAGQLAGRPRLEGRRGALRRSVAASTAG